MTSDITSARAGEAEGLLFDPWFDPIEDGLRAKVRGFIEAMIEEELTTALARPRYGRRSAGQTGQEAAAPVTGHRHGRRTGSLTGTFGPTEIAVPRARLDGQDGTTREWKSGGLRAYQRRTLAADALIAATYLAGTNTRRVRRALAAVFAEGVGKDVVSRVWRKVKTDWDAWNQRDLAAEPVVRLILDGTVVRVRLDRKATAISLLVVIGVREDGQKSLPPRRRGCCSRSRTWAGRRPRLGGPSSTTSSAAACAGRTSSLWTVRQVSSGRSRRSGTGCRRSGARFTSTGTCSPMRRSGCTRRSRPTSPT